MMRVGQFVQAALVWSLWLLGGVVDAATPRIEALPVGNVRMFIHEGGAVVRETYILQVTSPEMEVMFPAIPHEAESGSVQLIDQRREIAMNEWFRDIPSGPDRLNAWRNGDAVTLAIAQASTSRKGALGARLESRVTGMRQVDLVYHLTGITWRATYDVLVRGDLDKLDEPISVDVQGWFVIDNRTSRTFTNAEVVVEGPDTLGRKPEQKPPGMLMLEDDSALSDLWRFSPPPPLIPNRYEVGRALTIPAGRETLISFINAQRQPVEQRLLMRSSEIPTDTRSAGRAPSLMMSFENKRDYAGGRSAPPGEAAIYVGSRSAALYQKAWFKHAPPEADIRINLGEIAGVFVRRVDRGRKSRPDGGYEQVFELRARNDLGHTVTIVIDEAPLPALSWSVLRASHAYDLVNRQLIFTEEVKSGSEVAINYTLRVFTPEITPESP